MGSFSAHGLEAHASDQQSLCSAPWVRPHRIAGRTTHLATLAVFGSSVE